MCLKWYVGFVENLPPFPIWYNLGTHRPCIHQPKSQLCPLIHQILRGHYPVHFLLMSSHEMTGITWRCYRPKKYITNADRYQISIWNYHTYSKHRKLPVGVYKGLFLSQLLILAQCFTEKVTDASMTCQHKATDLPNAAPIGYFITQFLDFNHRTKTILINMCVCVCWSISNITIR